MLELKILPYPLKEVKITDRDYKFVEFPDDFPHIDPIWADNTLLSPVPSSLGKIKKMLFVLPKDAQADVRYNFFPVLREVIEKINTVEKFIIIHRGYELKLDKTFEAWLHKHPQVELVAIKNEEGGLAPDSELSIWSQDHFYPLRATINAHPQIYGMVGNIDSNFFFALERVAKHMDDTYVHPHFKLKQTGLPFEGGNILVGEDFMLVGINDYYEGVEEVYKKWFGRNTIIFVETPISPPKQRTYPKKNTNRMMSSNILPAFPAKFYDRFQPLFHLDLFLTLAGYNATKTSYTIVVGHPELGVEDVQEIEPDFYLFLNKWLTQMQASISSCVEHLKVSFKNQLNVKLEIVSVPLVLTYNDIITSSKRVREWFWTTYNNCLVEYIPTPLPASKKVWLPSYGHPKTSDYSHKVMDEEVARPVRAITTGIIKYGDWSFLGKYDKISKQVWKSLGFEVCLLQQNYLPFARQHGSLNCFTNCLDRAPSPLEPNIK